MTSKSGLTLYNYRSRRIEPFVPTASPVGYYTCGPTVYNVAHIGNLRTYLFEDLLKRTLCYFGYQVRHVMNITDVEDKIIHNALAQKLQIGALTKPFEERFYQNIDQLHIERADVYPRATEHIPQMIALIERLVAAGLAYESDGSVYFAVRKFPAYGKLAGIDLAQLKPGARVDVDEYDKDAAEDFVLWKAAKDEDHAVGAVWDSPWGPGRPGWHIECSAMSMDNLGETFDLHAGGIDLLFPHHEDEVAQSEGATGKEFARVFVEGEHIQVAGQKMAKSLGNFLSLDDIIEKGIDPLAFRYLILTTHYRSKLNFTWESLHAAQTTLNRVLETQYRPAQPIDDELVAAIDAALAKDLDLPRVIALLQDANNPALWEKYDVVLGLGFRVQTAQLDHSDQDLLAAREAARQKKDFAKADQLRDQLKARGWEIEDTAAGPRLIPKASAESSKSQTPSTK